MERKVGCHSLKEKLLVFAKLQWCKRNKTLQDVLLWGGGGELLRMITVCISVRRDELNI